MLVSNFNGMACRRLWAGLLLLAMAAIVDRAIAQESRGSITGIIMDSTGAVVNGATVTAMNTATGVPTSKTTNSSGNFSLSYLIPGKYSLAIEKTGFAQIEEMIEIRGGDQLRMDFRLSVASLNVSVEVKTDTQIGRAHA